MEVLDSHKPACITTRTSTFEQLEIAQKRLLKQILELPNRMADIAVYILTGIFPVEAQMHRYMKTCNMRPYYMYKHKPRGDLFCRDGNRQCAFFFFAFLYSFF
jgi:hypothetical protein